MDKEDIKKLYGWIQERVHLDRGVTEVTIKFEEPTEGDFKDAGFDEEVVILTLRSEWWPAMVADILETPEYAEPGESLEQILGYARDVVQEYVWKRLYT